MIMTYGCGLREGRNPIINILRKNCAKIACFYYFCRINKRNISKKMRKVYYIYNPQTQTYDRIYPTVRQRALSILRRLFYRYGAGSRLLHRIASDLRFSVGEGIANRKHAVFRRNIMYFPAVWMTLWGCFRIFSSVMIICIG